MDVSVGTVDPAASRYVVQLDSGEAFKLKPANLRAEVAGGGSGGGKTKGLSLIHISEPTRP